MVSHFREYFLFGLFFAIVTPLQIAWAGFVRQSPEDRRLLAAGAAGNGAIVVIWLVSRTVGLPLGPEILNAEAVHVTDVLATSAEILLVALVVTLLRDRSSHPLPSFAVAAAWTVATLGLVAALVGGGH